MRPAFWDSSSLVPLCVQQESTTASLSLLNESSIVVWWGTALELRSAFQRLLRMNHLTPAEHTAAARELEYLRTSWREIQPSEALRSYADTLLLTHPLKAADALQLAAALVWSSGNPQSNLFISNDAQLRNAARLVGIKIIET